MTRPPDTTAEPADLVGALRTAMRRHAAGVCILTTGAGEAVNGMAVTAVCSFSLDPPSMLVCVNRSASVVRDVEVGGRFGLSLLARGHEPVVEHFGRQPSGRGRFCDPSWRLEPGELPRLDGAPANLGCRLERTLEYGTHLAWIGRLEAVRLGPDAPSLVYRDGALGPFG